MLEGLKHSILGLSIGQKTIQALCIDQAGPKNTLTAVDEWPLNVWEDQDPTLSNTDRLKDTLSLFISAHRIQARRISVAVDTSFLFIHTIPLDKEVPKTELKERLRWELKEHFPDSLPQDFVTDTFELPGVNSNIANKVLSVSFRKNKAHDLDRMAKQLGMTLHIVDADHFAADTAFRVNYPDAANKFIALIGVKEHRLDVNLIRFGKMEKYFYHIVKDDNDIVEKIGRIGRDVKGLTSIMVYGSRLDKDFLAVIRSGNSLLVEALNPLRHVRVADELSTGDQLSVPSFRFVPAVGVAIRRN